MCHHTTGTLTHWLVNLVNAVTGNLDRAGGQMFTTPPVDVQRMARHLRLPHPDLDDRADGHPGFRFERPVAGLADDILEGDDRIRAMITYAGNPVLSSPNAGRLDTALDDLEFMVSIDMYVTETSRHADVILPPVSQLEREEFDVLFPVFSVRNNARWNARVFDPPPDGLEDWEILARLLVELTPLPGRRATAPVARGVLGQLSPMRLSALAVAVGPHGVLRRGLRGLTLGRIRRTPGGIDLGPLQPRLRELLGTPDRWVHLAPDDLLAEAHRLVEAPAAVAAGSDDEYDLQLIGRRHLRSNNSWMHNVPAMVKGRERCTVLMHPDDAAARGLEDRQCVTVASRVGTIEVPVEISDEIRAGTVAIPHGWGHDVDGVGWSTARANPGRNVNLLHDPSVVDTFTGNGALNATRVRVATT